MLRLWHKRCFGRPGKHTQAACLCWVDHWEVHTARAGLMMAALYAHEGDAYFASHVTLHS